MAASIDSADILLITVNHHETEALTSALETASGRKAVESQGRKHLEPYNDYGHINGQRVVHAFSMMGSTQSGASRDTTRKAIEDLNPTILIAVGIAWGAYENKQQIGDVLLSQQVQIGSPAKMLDSSIISRGPRPEMSSTPIKLIERTRANHFQATQTHCGVMLSRDELIDSVELRDKLVREIPELVGGEMEGQGIYEAIRDCESNLSWLIIKGICDWAYKKNANPDEKERNQICAAQAAANLIVKAIETYHFTKPRQLETIPLAAGSTSHGTVSIEKMNADEFLNALTMRDIDIEFAFSAPKPSADALVYWPVRIRQPNVVHAVQTFVAAALQVRGFDVRLCFDDLGRPDGYPDVQSGVNDLTDAVRKWSTRVTTSRNAEVIVSKIRRFSEFVGDSHSRRPQEGALALLGNNLVKWLMSSDKLKSVLSQSKLMKSDTDVHLEGRPRKLLSPAVVWTVLQMLATEHRSFITLGGEDEKPIWNAFPTDRIFKIANIYLPKVNGDMDTEHLQASSQRTISQALQSDLQVKEWFIRYAWHLPCLLMGTTSSLQDKLATEHAAASAQIWECLH